MTSEPYLILEITHHRPATPVCIHTTIFIKKLAEDMVLCKVHRKATSLKTLEQRAAMELEDTRMLKVHVYPAP
ncbi:hypothetical protein ACLOJK_002340 [Asimina triloba]